MSVLVGDRRSARALDIANVIVAIVVWLLVIAGSDPTINVTDPFAGQVVTAQDARSYFGLNLADLYAGRTDWNTIGAYPYSPAFAMLVYPLNLLPWTLFVAAWTALLIGAVWVLTGRELFLFGMVVGAMEIAGGNISLLLAVAIVWGFRWPWTWAFVLLTKITPGIGLLWFVLRREWRQLAIALGATAAVLAVSFVLTPFNWFAWVDLLDREHRQGRDVGVDPDPARRPPADRRPAHRVGRAAEPALGRAGRLHARAAGPVVRLALDAAGRHPAHDARGAIPRVGPRARGRPGALRPARKPVDTAARDPYWQSAFATFDDSGLVRMCAIDHATRTASIGLVGPDRGGPPIPDSGPSDLRANARGRGPLLGDATSFSRGGSRRRRSAVDRGGSSPLREDAS